MLGGTKLIFECNSELRAHLRNTPLSVDGIVMRINEIKEPNYLLSWYGRQITITRPGDSDAKDLLDKTGGKCACKQKDCYCSTGLLRRQANSAEEKYFVYARSAKELEVINKLKRGARITIEHDESDDFFPGNRYHVITQIRKGR